MKTMARLLATTAILATLATAAHSKTLVYCSEGSPEGFDPALYTAGTTFDASSRPVYNRLVEFERGTTKVDSRPGRELGSLRRRPGLHLQAASGRQVPDDRVLHADPRLQRRRRDLHLRAAARSPTIPWNKYVEGTLGILRRHGHARPLKEIEKVDDLTVKFMLNRPEAPFIANMAMDFASIMSKEYADKLQADGKMARSQPAAGRHRPVPVRRLPEGRGHPLQGQPRLLGRQAGDRRSRLRHHHRRLGALCRS